MSIVHLRATVLALVLSAAAAAGASPLKPSGGFVQLGAAEDASQMVVGAAWRWAWERDLGWGLATGYWEASLGRWIGEDENGSRSSALVTQVGATPVLRLQPRGWAWFVEGGIGVNLLAPVYRSRDKRFSTVFNFGDHIAVGRRFGPAGHHELALRLQHFSNAGIRRPNPGEDFVQLRYTRWY